MWAEWHYNEIIDDECLTQFKLDIDCCYGNMLCGYR